MISSKKSNIVMDMIVVILVIFIFSMVTLFGWKAFTEVNADIQNDLTLNESKEVMNEVESRYPSFFDGIILFILLGVWAMGVVSAYVSQQHPLIFGFTMLIVVFVLIAGAMIANYFEETYQDDELNTLIADFPKMNWVMTNLVELLVAMTVTIVLALLGRRSE